MPINTVTIHSNDYFSYLTYTPRGFDNWYWLPSNCMQDHWNPLIVRPICILYQPWYIIYFLLLLLSCLVLVAFLDRSIARSSTPWDSFWTNSTFLVTDCHYLRNLAFVIQNSWLQQSPSYLVGYNQGQIISNLAQIIWLPPIQLSPHGSYLLVLSKWLVCDVNINIIKIPTYYLPWSLTMKFDNHVLKMMDQGMQEHVNLFSYAYIYY